jgi:hypothetical protein
VEWLILLVVGLFAIVAWSKLPAHSPEKQEQLNQLQADLESRKQAHIDLARSGRIWGRCEQPLPGLLEPSIVRLEVSSETMALRGLRRWSSPRKLVHRFM